MPLQTPIVTSITSVHNGELWLRQAIDCLLRQTQPVNILVIDSGSNDGTYDICASYGKRIQYVITSLEPLYVSWNRALRLIDTRYAIINNADDWLEPRAVEYLCGALIGNTSTVISYSDSMIHFESDYKEERLQPDYERETLVQKCYVGASPMFDVDIARKCGGFDESMLVSADWDMWCKMTIHGRAVHVPKLLSHYRLRKDGIEHNNRHKQVEEDNQIRRRYSQG